MRDFYKRALPAQGVYCVTGINKGDALNLFAESLDELFDYVEQLKKKGVNIFIAPGTFNNHSRRADNSAFFRSFFVDLDVGETKPYKTQQDALLALSNFIDKFELPPPVRINSGNGIHAYWVFDEDVPAAEWKPYAKKFKQFLIDNGLSIDPVVTADPARIMRCPDTLNYKTDTPVPTSVIDKYFYSYAFSAFKNFLGEVEPDALSILQTIEKGLDEDTKRFLKFDNFEVTFQSIAEKSLMGDGCAQIKYILEQASILPEPLWYAGLSIARCCDDWETAIHLMSEDYPEYTHARTIRKAEQTVGKPQGCAVFDSHNPGVCNGCPHRGKITNPLHFGRKLKQEDPPPASPSPEKGEMSDPFKATYVVPAAKKITLPKELFPYVRGPVSGGIYFIPPPEVTKDGKKKQDPEILLTQHDLIPIKRMYSNVDGECLMMQASLPNDPRREFMLPMKDLYIPERFKETISKQGILFKNNQQVIQLLMDYVIKWGQYLINANSAEQMRMQMGWTENKQSFVIGDIEITSDGREVKTASSPFVKGIAKLLRSEGDYDTWKVAANALNEPGFEMHAFALLCGFGSTLMWETSTSGVVVCFTGKSGNAKTGALYGGLSIFGNPKDLSVFDATDNGMIGRYLGLHNIMLGCDEVSNKKPDQLSNLIHRISHGKAKIRMQASVNAERELEMAASLIGFFTSNQSVYDKLVELKASPDGEVARLVEFYIHKPAPLETDPRRGKQIFDTFRTNYGFAGPDFIKYYYKIGSDYAKNLVNKWSERFITDFGHDVSYRFYENLIAVTMAGGELAKEAGIIDYDLERIYYKVVTEMVSIRDHTVKLNYVDYKSLIGEFIDKHQSSMLILNKDRVVSEPRGSSLVARSEIHNQIVYVSKTEFRKFLSSMQVSSKEFDMAMKSENAMIEGAKKQRLSTGWKAGMQFPPVAVYAFKYDHDTTKLAAEAGTSQSENSDGKQQ